MLLLHIRHNDCTIQKDGVACRSDKASVLQAAIEHLTALRRMVAGGCDVAVASPAKGEARATEHNGDNEP